MIGSRQMDRVLAAAEKAGAKVVLVGDPEQLQAIEAGAAFRALAERHGASEITEVRRQREGWQRDATRELATGRTGTALERYEAAGMVQGHGSHEEARTAVVEGWGARREAAREEGREESAVILAHTRVDVAELNQLARGRMREGGELGQDQVVQTGRGERAFAAGDRLMFLRNERELGVKNGSLGQVEAVTAQRMAVRLDDGRRVAFDLKAYANVDHGYAATIHKAQGVTVDRAHVLASSGLDRHAAYVALTRHRDGVSLHYGADQFRDARELARVLGRERAKDTTLDYRESFAERRGISLPESLQRAAGRAPERQEGGFEKAVRELAGVGEAPRAQGGGGDERRHAAELMAGVRGYAAARAEAERTIRQGSPATERQQEAMSEARSALARVSPEAAADLRSALSRNPGLAERAATPAGAGEVMRAMTQEAEVRRSPDLRAARFVEDWRKLDTQREGLFRLSDRGARQAVEARMGRLAQELKRDPELQGALGDRRKELGLGVRSQGRAIGDELARSVARERDRGRER